MSPEGDKLEHLFSREIDGQASAEDQALLRELLDSDERMQDLFDEYRGIDTAAGDALRSMMGRAPRVIPLRRWWHGVGRGLFVAAAACIAMLFWLRSDVPSTSPVQPNGVQQARVGNGLELPGGSWFKAPAPRGDVVRPVPQAYERPQLRYRNTDSNWIIVPGNEPGEFFVIEVNRVRTHTIAVQRDF
jgi:hypothetical protein